MLVVSLIGVNFRFWSHLVCSGQNAIIFSRKGLVEGCTRKNINIFNIYIYIENRKSYTFIPTSLFRDYSLVRGF